MENALEVFKVFGPDIVRTKVELKDSVCVAQSHGEVLDAETRVGGPTVATLLLLKLDPNKILRKIQMGDACIPLEVLAQYEEVLRIQPLIAQIEQSNAVHAYRAQGHVAAMY